MARATQVFLQFGSTWTCSNSLVDSASKFDLSLVLFLLLLCVAILSQMLLTKVASVILQLLQIQVSPANVTEHTVWRLKRGIPTVITTGSRSDRFHLCHLFLC